MEVQGDIKGSGGVLGEEDGGLYDGEGLSELEAGEAGTGEIQEVGEEFIEALGLAGEDVCAFKLTGGGGMTAGEDAGGSADAGERVADFMGERGGELAGGGEALVFAEVLDVLGELVVDALEFIAGGFDVTALHAFAVCEEAGDDAGDAEGGELDDLILGVKAVRAPVADDGWREEEGGEEERAESAAPAEDEPGEEEGKDVEMVQDVVQDDGARGHYPDKDGEQDDHGGDEAGQDGP